MANTYELIEAKTLSTTPYSVTFTSIPQTYTDLVLKLSTRGGGTGLDIFFNNSTGAAYSERRLYGTGSSVGSDTGNTGLTISSQGGGNSYTANTFGNTEIYIPNYTSSNYKSVSADGVPENNATATLMMMTAGLWSSTAAITSITIGAYESTFISGSTFYLYGIKNS